MRSWPSVALAIALAACGTDSVARDDTDYSGDGSGDTDVCRTSYLDYDNFGAPFVINWCRGCHSSSVPQAMRQKARDYGYLRDNDQYHATVSGPGNIEIVPVDPAFYFLPVYDPLVVFGRPRAGLAVGISFGPRITLGAAFAPWGWGRSGFEWRSRSMIVDGHAWARSRENHEIYRHPYAAAPRAMGPRVERHELRPTRPERRGGRGR